MTAFEILAELRELGATVFVDGNNIRYRGPKGALTSELRQELARNKTEVLNILAAHNPAPLDLYLTESKDPPIRNELLGVHAPLACPPLPPGVRLIRYEPKSPPVAVQPCIVVTDVERFITHYLAELDARLNHPLQIRGGGGVWEILLKLQEIGVELGLELLNQVPRGTNPGTHMVRQGDEPLKKGHKRRKTTGPK